jgi:hypothetical protein
VRNERSRFLKQSRCYPCKDTLAPQSTGLPWSGLVSSTSLPCVRPAAALLDGAFPPVGRLGLTSPPSSVLCAATTATSPSRGPSLVACSPIPCLLPSFVVSPTGSEPGGSSRSRQGLWSPGPPLRVYDKETGSSPKFPSSPSEDMPRSQTPVVSCALATTHPGLLPSSHWTPSASHHVTLFGAPSRGLSPRDTRLRTAPYGEARGFAPDLLARR